MDINELKKERAKLKVRIKNWHDKGKNAKKLVCRFHEIQNKLIKLGVKATCRVEYLNLDYWDTFKDKSSPQRQKPQSPINNPIEPLQNSFILCLAWVDDHSNIPDQVIKVKKYFKELRLPILNEETNNIDDRIEHVLKYEFTGSEESFRLLKTCAQFVLDSFAKTDFERFNIAIYGKRKKF